jgi:hypothetical protein
VVDVESIDVSGQNVALLGQSTEIIPQMQVGANESGLYKQQFSPASQAEQPGDGPSIGFGVEEGIDIVDVEVVDVEVVDVGVVGSGVVASGVGASGVVDSGVVDSGVVDSGVVDSGVVDVEVVDSGVVDVEVVEVAVWIGVEVWEEMRASHAWLPDWWNGALKMTYTSAMHAAPSTTMAPSSVAGSVIGRVPPIASPPAAAAAPPAADTSAPLAVSSAAAKRLRHVASASASKPAFWKGSEIVSPATWLHNESSNGTRSAPRAPEN